MNDIIAATPDGAPLASPTGTAPTSSVAPTDASQTAATAAADKSTLLDKFAMKAEQLVKSIGHNEVFGVILGPRAEGYAFRHTHASLHTLTDTFTELRSLSHSR